MTTATGTPAQVPPQQGGPSSTDILEQGPGSDTADAPRDIAIIRAFVNSQDVETGQDDLSSRKDLSKLLQSLGLLQRRSPASETDFELALQLRRGLRAALNLNHETGPAQCPELDAAAARLPLVVRWDGGKPTLVAAEHGVAGALAEIAAAATRAAGDDTWPRLKICPADDCAWAYYDASKNRSKHWCGPGCSNKAKTRAYRARQKASADGS